MQGKAGNIRLAPSLVDIARCMVLMMSPRIARSRKVSSSPGFNVQQSGLNLLGETQPLKFGRSANHQPPQLGIAVWTAWPQIGDARALIRRTAKCPIKTGPPLGLDFFFQRGLDLPLAARSKLKGDALFGTRPKPPADVVAADHEIRTIIGTPTN